MTDFPVSTLASFSGFYKDHNIATFDFYIIRVKSYKFTSFVKYKLQNKLIIKRLHTEFYKYLKKNQLFFLNFKPFHPPIYLYIILYND